MIAFFANVAEMIGATVALIALGFAIYVWRRRNRRCPHCGGLVEVE